MTTRRQFLCVTAGIGGALSLGTVAGFRPPTGDLRSISATTPPAPALAITTRKSWALGCEVAMTVLHHNRQVAAIAVDEAFSELETVEQVMSIYRPNSQLRRLNREGQLDEPHPYLVDVLNIARDMSERSCGAFDITVQPLWELSSAHKQRGTSPDAEAIARAQKLVDWRRVQVSSGQIRLRGSGTAITLNGIAQGYATDRALAALQAHGVTQALLTTGEIGSLGQNGQSQPWTIGVQHPRSTEAYIAVTKLAGRCLATSGDYATRFSDDFHSHHIFDPRTGRSPTELASVSIAAETAVQADALSTAVFVLGAERGSELVHATERADALLVLENGRTLATAGFIL